MSKIVLGTVQFGVNYGINNTTGQVKPDEVAEILDKAAENGVLTLDTSSAYGTSEMVLGEALRQTGKQFHIVSKYPKGDVDVINAFSHSLQNLGVESLYGYLVHHFEFFQERPTIFDDMRRLKEEGFIQKIGFSIYNPQQLQYLIDHQVQFDIIQFPYNIFDRQFEPWLSTLKEKNVEIHTRSAFLQGLFFKDIDTIHGKLKPLSGYLKQLHEYCKKRDISVEQLSFGYVLSNAFVDGALIGVDNLQHFTKDIEISRFTLTNEDFNFIRSLQIKEKELLNPVNWN